MTDSAHRPAKLLSGGEKQRTAIACAIAEKPQVLLLDEPFAHIDLPNRSRLIPTIQKLVKQLKLACVFVTHDSIEALALSDRLGVIRNGNLEQLDSPMIVYKSPKNTYIAELTGEVNLLKPIIYEQIFGEKPTTILPEKLAMIRPEEIKISNSQFLNAVEAIIQQVIFCGSYFKIQVQIDKQKLWVVTDDKFVSHESVFIGKKS